MTPYPVAILGAGLAGLQMRRLLDQKGVKTITLESHARTGGLCRTETNGIWSWDVGPHAFYSRRPEIMSEYTALPIAYRRHARAVRVAHRSGGAIHEVGYPFENGIADLPLRERWDCVTGYWNAWARGERPFRNLRHWIDNGLGGGIGRLFMTPYNEKIWSLPLERISMELVKAKIEPEPPWKIARNALIPGTVGRAYQANFIYPEKGGAGALPEAVERACAAELRKGFEAARISRNDGLWSIVSPLGESVSARRIVSTIPIPVLLSALNDPDLDRFKNNFSANDTWMVAVGLKEGRSFGRFAKRHWVFFAGPESFYRLTFMSAFDSERPSTVVAEITKKDGVPAGAALEGQVLADLLEAGVLRSEEDVGLVSARLEPFTYPLQTVGLEAARAELEDILAARGISLLGRSGRWDYVNTDGIFALAARCAEGFSSS